MPMAEPLSSTGGRWLHSAIRSGLRWVYGVRRPDSSATAHRHEEFESVDGVVDLL